MPEYSFDHVHLRSLDPKKTAEFYQNTFGANIISIKDRGNGRVMVNLKLGAVTILISPAPPGVVEAGLGHLGIRTDNLIEAVDELKAKGVKFTQEIKNAGPGFNVSFLLAPENVPVELQEGEP